MNTTEIRKILNAAIDVRYTTEVLACDQLHLVKSNEFALIINSDTSDKPGTHWLALFKEASNDIIEFFDSFSMPVEFYNPHILKFINERCNYLNQSRIQIQSNLSTTCGHFCIFYLIQRTRGVTFENILSEFSRTNLVKNDKKVETFVNENFYLRNVSSHSTESTRDDTFIGEIIIQCCKVLNNIIHLQHLE